MAKTVTEDDGSTSVRQTNRDAALKHAVEFAKLFNRNASAEDTVQVAQAFYEFLERDNADGNAS